MGSKDILDVMNSSGYNRRGLFVMFIIVMIALTIDVSISNVADIISKQAVSFWGIFLFTIIATICIMGLFFILQMIKAKNKDSKFRYRNIQKLEKTTTIVQYSLMGIMALVVLQIILTSHYYTTLLILAVAISYGLATSLTALLAYKLFSWFKLNKSLVVLLFGLAAGAISVNAIDSLVYFNVVLLGKPSVILPESPVIFQVGFAPGTAMSVVAFVQSNSLIAYFVLTWGGTILLLRHNIQRVGRVKFWILVCVPIVYFMSYYVLYTKLQTPPVQSPQQYRLVCCYLSYSIHIQEI